MSFITIEDFKETFKLQGLNFQRSSSIKYHLFLEFILFNSNLFFNIPKFEGIVLNLQRLKSIFASHSIILIKIMLRIISIMRNFVTCFLI
jgi:hypothetical protein